LKRERITVTFRSDNSERPEKSHYELPNASNMSLIQIEASVQRGKDTMENL
jgi:hypothetical protein